MSKTSNITDYNSILKEFECRVNKYILLVDDKLVLFTRYICAILVNCDNAYNQHFVENALILFTFVQYEIDALTYGCLPLDGQEKFYKGFISTQFGSFDNKKKDKTTRLTSCCAEYLLTETDADDTDQVLYIEGLKGKLFTCGSQLQPLADTIVTALKSKNKGKGFQFALSVKYYKGYKYTSDCFGAPGKQAPRVSDGEALLKHAVSVQKRDLFNEITSLSIMPSREFPHGDIVAVENALIAKEEERRRDEQAAAQRRMVENEIIAEKRDEAKKRKREDALKAAAARAAAKSSDSEPGSPPNAKRNTSSKATKKQHVKKSRQESTKHEDDSVEDDGGFTLAHFAGDVNDDNVMRKNGRKKPVSTGNLDLLRDPGYDDFDNVVVNNLRGPIAMKNFILRGGQVSLSTALTDHQGVMKKPTPFRVMDDEWDEPVKATGDKTTRKSQLDDLNFDDCESPDRSKNYLDSNFIDHGSSSDEDSRGSRVRGISSIDRQKKRKKRTPVANNKRTSQKLSGAAKKTAFKSRGNDSDSSGADGADGARKDLSSSDSDFKTTKRKRRVTKSKAPTTAPAVGTTDTAQDKGEDDTKPARTRTIVGLSEQQLTQYANLNCVPFQLTASQHQSARSELFEVDGKLMSDDEIKNLIIDDADIINQNLDAKFMSFVRQHIMVEVFKDVYFLTNVILYYRSKRFLLNSPTGNHLVCQWQIVLKEVGNVLIKELEASNQKIIKTMDQNLLDLKELRRQQRHEETLIIGSDEEKERNARDYEDLKDYKRQMKLSLTALEEVEKVMKRRINTCAHTTGAKIVCIWAKLNGYQHLLSGNMSKFEKKFLLDVTMPLYSVLSDDLSRRWGNVVTSPTSLFRGVDIRDSNRAASSSSASDVVVEVMDNAERIPRSLPSESSEEMVLFTSQSLGNGSPTVVKISEEEINPSSFSSPHVRFPDPSELGVARMKEEDTPPQDRVEDFSANDKSFLSPLSELTLTESTTLFPSSNNVDAVVPSRPAKTAVYTSALLSGTPNGSPFSQGSSPDQTDHYLTSSGTKEFSTPSLSSSEHPAARNFSVSSRGRRNASTSYLSSIGNTSASSSDSSPQAPLCDSNFAVLFDELKHMNTSPETVDSMIRMIKVMCEKPANVQMPATTEEEDKILKKSEAKAKKEETKKTAAAEDAKKAAALLASAAAGTSSDGGKLRSADDDEHEQSYATAAAVVRHKTDSYTLFQKLFLFICKKHVEVKDSRLNLQFFGQRLVKTMSNTALLSFLLLLFQNRNKPSTTLVLYLLHEKLVSSELNCAFGLAYSADDYFNILGDGYCVLRSMFAMLSNEQSDYEMSVADMREADRNLFKSKKSREAFYGLLSSTRDSISANCTNESAKTADKKKLKTTMTLFASFPQLKQLPAAYWGCLDWVVHAQFNCTAFSTNYGDCVPGYAQLHCSSALRRDISESIPPYSVADVRRVLDEPVRPNFCVLEGQHAFIVNSPSKDAALTSFMSVFGLFLDVCVKSLDEIAVDHVAEFPLVEDVIKKMITDNTYMLSEAEAKLMTKIIRFTDGVLSTDSVKSESIVLCAVDCVPPVSLEAFNGSRGGDGVIDLCDSDTGDVDRSKMRAVQRAKLDKQEQDLVALRFKFESSERENKFLLRLIGKDPLLMHDPPLDIAQE